MSAFRMGTYTVAVAALALMMFFVADEVSAAVEISPGGTSTLSDGVEKEFDFGAIVYHEDYYYFKIKPKRTGYIKALNNYSHGYTFALLNS